jgi:hypothetical protein
LTKNRRVSSGDLGSNNDATFGSTQALAESTETNKAHMVDYEHIAAALAAALLRPIPARSSGEKNAIRDHAVHHAVDFYLAVLAEMARRQQASGDVDG